MNDRQLTFLQAIAHLPMGSEFTASSVAESSVWDTKPEKALMGRIAAQLMNGSVTWITRKKTGGVYKRGSFFTHAYVLSDDITKIFPYRSCEIDKQKGVSFFVAGEYAKILTNTRSNKEITDMVQKRFHEIIIGNQITDGMIEVTVPCYDLTELLTFCQASYALQYAFDIFTMNTFNNI